MKDKGFVPVDGCFQNIKLLQEAIQARRKKKKEVNVVLLYLANVFDTVLHDSFVKALRAQQVPKQVIDGIKDMYREAETVIRVGGRKTKPIKIRSGVKKGCPLSPLLFSLVMNDLLDRIESSGIGIKVKDGRIGGMDLRTT